MMTNYVPMANNINKNQLKAKNNGQYTLCFKNANKDFLTMVAKYNNHEHAYKKVELKNQGATKTKLGQFDAHKGKEKRHSSVA